MYNSYDSSYEASVAVYKHILLLLLYCEVKHVLSVQTPVTVALQEEL